MMESESEASCQIAESMNTFGFNLFHGLVSQDGENVLVCPVSVAIALGMVAAGTTPASPSAQQFDQLLGLPLSQSDSEAAKIQALFQELSSWDPKVSLVVASSLWSSSTILPEYRARIAGTFSADALPLPSSPGPINSWVKEKTAGLITSILEEDDPQMAAVLLNAVYFKGEWTNKFDKSNTKETPFKLASGATVSSQMMFQKFAGQKKVKYAEIKLSGEAVQEGDNDYDAQMVVLPYGAGNRFQAIFLLPKESQPANTADAGPLGKVVKAAGEGEVWGRWERQLKKREVKVSLPRFKLEYGVKDLTSALKEMGLEAPFQAIFLLPKESQPANAAGEAGPLGEVAKAAGKGRVWEQWERQLRRREARVSLPRFKLEYGVKDLTSALKEMGLEAPFQAGLGGEFQGQFLRMTEDPLAYLSSVLHKTVLEINEEGTEAAAATAAIMMTRAIMIEPPPVEIEMDRPFLFMLQDAQSKLVMFLGKIDSPQFK
eukprot:CAMPEP_0196598294 /NCGR_PEP_ID=MMETSP1081-20130531/94237_1 /TAXON_ID=36882 /ORGANISM="Pyramimonas amylifera, Strain CCMP720" /LENGTH=487 /DNA_ID=CAMNT_0041923971 /DNA_START=226 /DNA_END=1689 /DNA_ORIENTATION=+